MKALILAQTFNEKRDEAIIGALIDYLDKRGLPYKTIHRDGMLDVFVYNQEDRSTISHFVSQYVYHDTSLPNKMFIPDVLSQVCRHSVTAFCIGLSMLCFLLSCFESWHFLSLFSFQDFNMGTYKAKVSVFDSMINIIHDAEVWRLFTPVFLHFSWESLVFNVIAIGYLGSQIESKDGKLSWILTLAFLSLISNLSQFYLFPSIVLGGFTGVAYGLMAYCWLSNRYHKQTIYQLSLAFIMLMVIVALMGYFNFYGISWIHSAHLGPIFAGCVLVFFRRHVFLARQ